jgi:transposase
LDIAKSVFLVHGVDAAGHVVLRQRLSRSRVLEFLAKLPRCLVGVEACASSNYWARELITQGHEVKLMPAQYVKPYVKRGKNDAADAEAICEAATRPTMRFVGVKTPEQQSIMMLHRVRLILMRQRTQLSNALRSHLAEFGIVSPIGREGLDRLLTIVADTDDARVAAEARASLEMLAVQLEGVKAQILENDRRIIASARATEVGRRLLEVPGIGPVLASAFVASVADPTIFKSGRDLAAWIGLVPRQNSSGGKERLRGITKAGNGYLRADADGRRHSGDPLRPAQQCSPALARAAHGSPPNKGRGYRTRQQDSSNGVGADGQRERYRDPGAIQAAVSATL